MLTDLYSASAIAERVSDIAGSLNKEFKDEKIVHAIVTLNGAFIFAADLLRQLNFPLVVHFAGATSYYGVERKDLRINANALPESFGNTPVLLIEDIVDSGNTVNMLRKIIADRYASNIKVASLLKRQSSRGNVDYFGFTVPKGLFVVGYGMDMDGRYRELKDISTLGTTAGGGLC